MEKLKKYGFYVGVPLLLFVFYLLFSVAVSRLVSNTFIAMALSDGTMLLLSIAFCLRFQVLKKAPERYQFSGWGFALVFLTFCGVWFTSQGVAAYFRNIFPSPYMQIYDDLLGSRDAILYSILSVFLAPVTEELLFRGILYRHVSNGTNKIFAFVLSSVLFWFIHGTFIHFPITLAVSVMCVWIWEMTGSFTWSVVCHMLFNLFGVSYMISTNWTFTSFIICYYCLMIIFGVSFIFLSQTRDLLKKDRFGSFEAYVDRKRRALLDVYDTTGSSASDDTKICDTERIDTNDVKVTEVTEETDESSKGM